MKVSVKWTQVDNILEKDWATAFQAGGITWDYANQYLTWWQIEDQELMGCTIVGPEYTIVSERGDVLWQGISREEARKVKSLLKGVHVPSLAEGT